MTTNHPLLDLAVRRGLISPEQARAHADVRAPAEMVARGLIAPAEGRLLEDLYANLTRELDTPVTPPSGAVTRLMEGLSEETAPPPSAPPRRVGRYEILGELGRGGMGIVYRALDGELHRVVAIKVMRAGLLEPERIRFLREARAIAGLRHPRIIPVFDIGEDEGRPFFVMEFVEGDCLLHAIEAGTLTRRESVEIVRQAAEGVAFAHRHGVLHRDLKPANILVTPKKQAYVSDFGLAKLRDADDAKVSTSGMTLGTPGYMSPEQALGRLDGVDARSDVYCLGATLYHVLTGLAPFEGGALGEVIQRVLHCDPIPPRIANPSIERDLETICLKAMEKDPQRRYSSAREFAEDLGRFLAGEPIQARPPSVTHKVARWARRWRVALLATLAVALLSAAAAAGLTYRAFRSARADALAARDAGDWTRVRIECERALRIRRDPELGELLRTAEARLAEQSRLAAFRERIRPIEQLVRDTRVYFYAPTSDLSVRIARLEEALAELEGWTADPLHARCIEAWRTLGMGWYLLGDATRAERALARAETLDPGDSWVNYTTARLLLDRGQLDLIRKQGSLLFADNARAARERLARPTRRWEGAEEIDRLVAEACLAFAEGDASKTLRLCAEGLEKFGSAMGTEELWNLRAWLDEKNRESHLKAALRIRPHYPWVMLLLAARAPTARERIDRIDALLRIQPRLALGWSLRGAERHLAGDSAGALADLEKSIQLDPSQPGAYLNRAAIRIERLEFEKAIGDCTTAIALRPKLAFGYYLRGNARLGMDDFAAAIRDYTDALHLEKTVDAFVNRGNCRQRLGDSDGAMADYTEALKLAPEDAELLVNRGVVLESIGRLDEAIADYDRAIRISPRLPIAYMNRGLARHRKGDRAGAIADLEECLAHAPADWPNRKPVEEILRKLGG